MQIVTSEATRSALRERLAMLELLWSADTSGMPDLYLVDFSKATLTAAMTAKARGKVYVLDIGDDPRSLGASSGLSRREASARGLLAAAMMSGAAGIVHRGFYHRIMLQAQGIHKPLLWAPDSVEDSLLQLDHGTPDPELVCTFGSITNLIPKKTWPEYYGAELLSLLDAQPSLRGLVVARGPGTDAFRSEVKSRGLSDRIEYKTDMSLGDLFREVRRATYVTSYQTDNPAGWCRTTGKLPLVLGAGRCLLATDVGEASRVLPKSQLLGTDAAAFVAGAVDRIARGWTTADGAAALHAAETYRRGNVADRLRHWLRTVRACV